MSKFLNIPTGNYQIKVQSGGTITLDTGVESGTVIITGDLRVEGDTTTVDTTNLNIEDNIIVLNKNEPGPGITATSKSAGIEIERGTVPNAIFVYDENLTNPVTGSPGLFEFKVGLDTIGIVANSISTKNNNDLLISTGTGVISVSGTTNYELNITDDDDITNKKYVDDAISTAFASVLLPQIGEGTIKPSRVAVSDNELSGQESQINFVIDDVNIGNFYSNRFELGNIRITDTIIETITSNDDLFLSAPGTGDVVIDDTLRISSVPGIDDIETEPLAPIDGVKIYTSSESTGKTGIYYVNQNQTRDEIISKNRALLFSMIF